MGLKTGKLDGIEYSPQFMRMENQNPI
jgi:hypothetical protein